ncbi:Putative F-box protein At1g47765 [Linum grandiflorum]
MTGFSEEKKKKKQIRVISVDKNKKADCLIVDDDLVVTQILSRLPVKSLMRFKCVCKSWKSIIEQDSHFINLHNSLSQDPGPIVLTSDNKYNARLGGRRELSLLSLELHSNYANVHSVSRIYPSITETRQHFGELLQPMGGLLWRDVEFLGPVRGLLCLVDRFNVRIWNVNTGVAVTPWIKSMVFTTVRNEKDFLDYPTCLFGFDRGNHKVVFLWDEHPRGCPPVCEVLTVGSTSTSTSWRIIDSVMPLCERPFQHTVACSNGSVYWVTKKYHRGVDYDEFLVAFDICSEQFRIITIPKFTRNTDVAVRIDCVGTATEMDGCPAVYRSDECTLKMWKFHDCRSGGSSSSDEKDWTEVKIIRPSFIPYKHIICFHSIPGKDVLILETYDPSSNPVGHRPFMDWRNVKRAVFYRYDLKDETWSEFEVRGISFLPDVSVNRCATLVETLLSV